MRLFYFNPENDLALAQGGVNYVPPPHAVALRRDLALLPMWLARPGDALLVVDGQPRDRLQQWVDDHCPGITVVEPTRLRRLPISEVCPWGWSLDLRRRLIKWGVNKGILPTVTDIENWRQVSHRRSSIAIHEAIRSHLNLPLSPVPQLITSVDEAIRFATDHPGCFLKAPWSGSGAGVRRITAAPARDLRQWLEGIVRRQGAVVAEHGLDRRLDFALEFRRDSDGTRFLGFSIFHNDDHNQYDYGIVDSHRALEQRIANLYPYISRVGEAITRVLETILAPVNYRGFLGVDMLLYRPATTVPPATSVPPATTVPHVFADYELALNPCVELNLRATMGLITVALAGALADNLPARFKINPVPVSHRLTQQNTNEIFADQCPTFTTVPLTPTLPTTRHTATLTHCPTHRR